VCGYGGIGRFEIEETRKTVSGLVFVSRQTGIRQLKMGPNTVSASPNDASCVPLLIKAKVVICSVSATLTSVEGATLIWLP
jgi:hypothetical protein